jgi:hypothetical protein
MADDKIDFANVLKREFLEAGTIAVTGCRQYFSLPG